MSNYTPTEYLLKSPDKVFCPVEFFSFSGHPTLESYHASIAVYKLDETVPIKVHELFETAKNLQLYSLYVYRFGMVAAKQAIAAMELALRIYASNEGYKNLGGLKKLLKRAQQDKWIDLSLVSPTNSARQFVDSICNIRNEFAHGSEMLMDPSFFVSMLKSTSQVINQLYSDYKPFLSETNCNGQRSLGKDRSFISNHVFGVPYEMQCSECRYIYGANSCDVHLRKCPVCQGGAPGLERI